MCWWRLQSPHTRSTPGTGSEGGRTGPPRSPLLELGAPPCPEPAGPHSLVVHHPPYSPSDTCPRSPTPGPGARRGAPVVLACHEAPRQPGARDGLEGMHCSGRSARCRRLRFRRSPEWESVEQTLPAPRGRQGRLGPQWTACPGLSTY
ncbi:hypothetical protein HJG60_008802 [Phyllostomus discolor]|uniref:Uncharacterized protein n=1 Tax=Phyllostomus discolor TaxID=89673 RepID=A0A833YM77_9CHIR|nr:hypothetical protein HJG60_008802 [Phyllostomus discolor]